MVNPPKIRVLNELNPHLRLILAYKREHFHIFYTICATIIWIAIPIPIVLGTWCLVEKGDLMKIVVGLPILTNLLTMELSFITLVLKNHTVIEMVARLQDAVDKSE